MATRNELRAEAHAPSDIGHVSQPYDWAGVTPDLRSHRLQPTLVLADKLAAAGPDLSDLHLVKADAMRPLFGFKLPPYPERPAKFPAGLRDPERYYDDPDLVLEGEGRECPTCSGCGEGRNEGARCIACGGSGDAR